MNKRPAIIWLALIYLVGTLLLNLVVVVQNIGYLMSGMEGIIGLLINLAFCVLVIATFNAIRERAETGRNFAVKSFAILGFFSIYNSVVLLNISFIENVLVPGLIIAFRIAVSIFFAVYFATSGVAKSYFREKATEPA